MNWSIIDLDERNLNLAAHYRQCQNELNLILYFHLNDGLTLHYVLTTTNKIFVLDSQLCRFLVVFTLYSPHPQLVPLLVMVCKHISSYFSLQPCLHLIRIVRPHQKGKWTPRRGEKVFDSLTSADSAGDGLTDISRGLKGIFSVPPQSQGPVMQ